MEPLRKSLNDMCHFSNMIGVALLLAAGSAYENCTQPVNRLYNTAAEYTLAAKEWVYFYSDFNLLGDKLTVSVYPQANDVALYTGSGLTCPTTAEEAVATAKKGKFTKHQMSVDSELGLQIFGVYAETETTVVIGVSGQNPNNADLGQWRAITCIFLAAAIILLVSLFVHSILARGKVHYQVEVNE